MPASTCRRCIRPASPPKADDWTLDTFLKAAEACHKAGYPFGIGLGTTSDSVDTAGAFFHALRRRCSSTPRARSRSRSDAVRQALDYCKRAGAVLSAGCAGLGRRLQQQVAGLRQGRADHEPAERLGGGQARRAAGRRAVLDARLPGGPEGPLRAVPALLLGHLELRQEQVGGQEPAACTCRSAAAVEKLVAASGGYDLPSFANLTTLKTWAEEGPPKGTLYHYPNPHNHQILSIAAAPAPPKIAVQIYTQGDPDQDDRAPPAGRDDGEDARLGRERGRRLHAHLSASCSLAPRDARPIAEAAAIAPAATCRRDDEDDDGRCSHCRSRRSRAAARARRRACADACSASRRSPSSWRCR